MQEGPVWRLPDAAVVFERAGSLLTLQAELNGAWVVFFLQEKNRGNEAENTEPHVWTGSL